MIVRPRFATLAAAIGLLVPSTASPQSVPSQAAPQQWLAYADIVNQAVTSRLTGADPIAVRLRAYLDQIPGPTADAGVRLPIQVWIDGKGVVTKVDFAPFAQEKPNADLHALLTGLHLSKAPPRKMLLPIRMTISLDPAAAGAPANMTRIQESAPIRT